MSYPPYYPISKPGRGFPNPSDPLPRSFAGASVEVDPEPTKPAESEIDRNIEALSEAHRAASALVDALEGRLHKVLLAYACGGPGENRADATEGMLDRNCALSCALSDKVIDADAINKRLYEILQRLVL